MVPLVLLALLTLSGLLDRLAPPEPRASADRGDLPAHPASRVHRDLREWRAKRDRLDRLANPAR